MARLHPKAPLFKMPPPPGMIVLTDRQRDVLLKLGTQMQFEPRGTIYVRDATADSVFAVLDGVVKTFQDLRSGKRVISAFLFPRDILGLAERRRYVNSAQAITKATLLRLPMEPFSTLLKRDGELQYKFLAKVTHELRESQRRAILVNRRDAAGRVAMFLVLMRDRTTPAGARAPLVPLPMTRTDIAAFLGLSIESVSRAIAALERRRFVAFESRAQLRILDQAGLTELAAGT